LLISLDKPVFCVGAYENTVPTGQGFSRHSDDEYWDLDDFQSSQAMREQWTGLVSQDQAEGLCACYGGMRNHASDVSGVFGEFREEYQSG